MAVTSNRKTVETGVRHPLLELRRESGTRVSPPEPTWVLRRNDENLVVWEPPERTNPVLTVEDWTEPDWVLVLELWERYRSFSPLEKALVVAELGEGLTDERRRGLAELLDLPPSEPLFEALSNIRTYPEVFHDQLHQGDLSLRTVRYLDQLPEPVRGPVVEGLSEGTVKLSVQEIRQLEEATRRLTEDQIEELNELSVECRDPENPGNAGSELLESTREMAFPRTRERRDQFQSTLNSLDLDGRISVSAPTNFEGDYVDVKFRCRRDEDIIQLAEELKRCKKLLKHL